MRTLLALLAGGMLGAVAPASVVGQPDPATSPARRPGWLPRYSKLDPSLTAAERATILKRLNEIERLVLQVPELARPEGFEVWPTVTATGFEIWPVIQGHPKANYVVQTYELTAFRPTKAIAGEGLTCLTITINPVPSQVSWEYAQNDFEDGKGDRVWIENRFGVKKPGALLAYGHILPGPGEPPSPVPSGFSPTNPSAYAVFFSADGVSPWLEVTRQEYLEALIWSWETSDLKEIERIRQSLTKTRYERWMEEAPKRKRERDEVLAGVEKINPSQAAAFRKELEATERQMTEQLKAAEDEDRAENARVLAQGMPADHLRAQLAAMTPDQRAMSAWTRGGGSIEFFQPNAPEAVRIVRANPAFYRTRSSRTLPRGIIARFNTIQTCGAPEVQGAFYAAYRNLDWAALRRLLGQ